MSRATHLARRRAMLIAECQIQRAILRTQGRRFTGDQGWLTSGASLLERLRNLPGWINILLGAAVILIPGRATRLARSGLMLWQLLQSMKSTKSEPK